MAAETATGPSATLTRNSTPAACCPRRLRAHAVAAEELQAALKADWRVKHTWLTSRARRRGHLNTTQHNRLGYKVKISYQVNRKPGSIGPEQNETHEQLETAPICAPQSLATGTIVAASNPP